MPEMNGDVLGEAIKSDAGIRDTVLILMSSVAQRGDAWPLREIGFAVLLNKPVRQSELYNSLAAVLGGTPAPEWKPEKKPPSASALPALNGKSIRILVVEDNFTNQQVAKGLLAKLGVHADAVANGAEAIAALSRNALRSGSDGRANAGHGRARSVAADSGRRVAGPAITQFRSSL